MVLWRPLPAADWKEGRIMANLRPNRAKRRLAEGGVVTVAGGLMTPDMVDFLGPLGFDAMWLEAEHGPVDYGDIPDLTRACDVWGFSSIVRVNRNVPGVIYRTLDLGAQGIVVPHVNTADEARAVVEAAKFHPIGRRGMAGGRWAYGVDDHLRRANDETLIVVIIEDIVAVDNLAEILAVDHIDVFFVAPGDLGQSMGHLGPGIDAEVQTTIDRALREIDAAGRAAGAMVSDSNVGHYLDLGTRFLLTPWTQWVAAGAEAYLERVAAGTR